MSNTDNLPFDPDKLPFFKTGKVFDPAFKSFAEFAVEVAADEVFLMQPDSEIVYANQSACDRLGYRQNELVGMKVWEWDPLFPQSAWPGFWAEFVDKKHLHFETQHRTKDGEIFPVEIHAHYYSENNNEYLLAFVNDLTTLKKIQNDKISTIDSAKQLAETANKAKSQMLANMSHELRTPMHAIRSFIQLAQKKMSDDKGATWLGNALQSADRLTSLLNLLLDLSKLESGRMPFEPVQTNINQEIRDALITTTPLADEKNISINFIVSENIDSLIDPTLFDQLIINLIGNAIKYSPPNSLITITLGKIKDDDASFLITISDEGIGFPADEIDKVFDKFYMTSRTDKGSGGTGLGLSIVKEIIDLHQGSIRIESPAVTQTSGSTFFITLPYWLDTQSHSSSNEKYRILIIDDDPVILRVLTNYLETEGHKVTTSGSGLHIDLLIEDSSPDVLICDINLPELQGDEVLAKAKALKPDLVTLSISGDVEIIQSQFDLNLTKPIAKNKLLSSLHEMVNKSRNGD